MAERKCFLECCSATVGDCLNPTCECLICLGQNKEKCKTLHNKQKFQVQQIVCESCKNYKGM